MFNHGFLWNWGWFTDILIIALIIWLIVRLINQGGITATGSAERILKERYARGEITKEEFENKLQDLRK